jgi:hypothetical protein
MFPVYSTLRVCVWMCQLKVKRRRKGIKVGVLVHNSRTKSPRFYWLFFFLVLPSRYVVCKETGNEKSSEFYSTGKVEN